MPIAILTCFSSSIFKPPDFSIIFLTRQALFKTKKNLYNCLSAKYTKIFIKFLFVLKKFVCIITILSLYIASVNIFQDLKIDKSLKKTTKGYLPYTKNEENTATLKTSA
jgi:ABC-type protease/lipase transport system fused ATPase/permease subunit